MTALVGFYCKDGVVIGADSAATAAAPLGQSGAISTIEQEVEKISIISDRVIIAGTGEVGLGQRFCDEVKRFHDDKGFANGTHVTSATELCARALKNFAHTQTTKGSYGALAAFPHKKKFHLVEFALSNFQPEFKDNGMCFVSMGGGQLICDSFLGLLRRVFFRTETPTVAEATFFTAWTLHQAIELNPGGIRAPIKIAVLKSGQDGEAHARMLNSDEIGEHIEHIKGVERHLADYRKIMVSAPAAAPIPELKPSGAGG